MSNAHWNQDKFDRTLRQHLSVTSLTLQQAMNKKGYDLTLATSKETPMTSRQTILDAVGPTGSKVIGQKVRFLKGRLNKKTGLRVGARVKRGSDINENTFGELAIALAITRLGARAQVPHAWPLIIKTANKIYRARLRSRGFIKQGWIPARVIMRRSDRGRGAEPALNDHDMEGLGKYGAAVKAGGAAPASRGFSPLLKIWNATSSALHANVRALTIGSAALRRGFDLVTADMQKYLDRKMGKDAAAFNRAQK